MVDESGQTDAAREPLRLTRTYDAEPQRIWSLWTTGAGIESWWAPDGYTVAVQKLRACPGGELIYTMTATAPDQVEFLRGIGLPLTTEARKTFVELDPCSRLVYSSLVDFVPGVASYEVLTEVEMRPVGARTSVLMTVEPMHDQEWTRRLVTGRSNELDNLAEVLARRGPVAGA